MMHSGPTSELSAREGLTSIQAGRKGCGTVQEQKNGRIAVFAASSESTRGEKDLINLTSLERSRLASTGITLKCTTQALQGPTLSVKRDVVWEHA